MTDNTLTEAQSALPHPQIEPIPNNEPDATPGLWNTRYEQIDENFTDLDQRAQSVEQELKDARGQEPSLGVLIKALREQVGGINGELSGLASPASVQAAVSLDWLYRNRRIAFELFASGYTLVNHPGTQVLQGIMGDDSLDVLSTEGIKMGEHYLITEGDAVEVVKVTAILSPNRLRLAGNLERVWSAKAKLGGTTMQPLLQGGVMAQVGAQWISKAINLGDDRSTRAVVIRRSLSAGDLKLFYRDGYAQEWVERPWSMRRSGGGTSGVPDGFADYEYMVPMRGDGYLRVVADVETMTIRHIIGLGGVTGLGGYINPEMRPDAPSIVAPAAGSIGVGETPTVTISTFSSPAGNAVESAELQISTVSNFSALTHSVESVKGATYSVPAGLLKANTQYFVRARYLDVAGLQSDWSPVTAFTTKESYQYVATPVITSPKNGQLSIPEQPTIQSVVFAAMGAQDVHASSRWQVRLASGSWADPLYDTGEIAGDQTSFTLPASVLRAGQTEYVVRVRYTGQALGVSEWSADVSFTTRQQFQQILGIVLAADGGGAGRWQRIDSDFEAITTDASTFAGHPTYAGIVEQIVEGQYMVKMPKFYAKGGTVPKGPYAGKRYWMISDRLVEGFTTHPAFMKAGKEIDQFWVAKYQACEDGSRLGSQPDVLPLTTLNYDTFKSRANARNSGGVTGFSMWNIYHLSAIQLLMLIEMGGADSQTLIGPGFTNSNSNIKANTNDPRVLTSFWRGIVGLWGNTQSIVEGLQTGTSSTLVLMKNDGSGGYVNTGKVLPTSGWLYSVFGEEAKGTGFDLSILFMPATTNGLQANGTFGDYYNGTQSDGYMTHGGAMSQGAWAGIFFFRVGDPFSNTGAAATSSTTGTRLAKV